MATKTARRQDPSLGRASDEISKTHFTSTSSSPETNNVEVRSPNAKVDVKVKLKEMGWFPRLSLFPSIQPMSSFDHCEGIKNNCERTNLMWAWLVIK